MFELRNASYNTLSFSKFLLYFLFCILVMQLVIEELAASDSGEGDVRLTGTGEQLQVLSLPQWCHLLERAATTLLRLIHHVKVRLTRS